MSLFNDEQTDKPIDETETRPALYNKNLKEYSDISLKRRLWLEVCEAVFEDWNNKTGQQNNPDYTGIIVFKMGRHHHHVQSTHKLSLMILLRTLHVLIL
jgi:hypothetical protein